MDNICYLENNIADLNNPLSTKLVNGGRHVIGCF